jgi:guanylate kinase
MAWRIDGCASTGDLDIFAVDETLGDYRVAMIECDDNTVDEQAVMANARLIMAAPDLLAALEDMLNLTLDEDDIAVSSRITKARAAIAKAKEVL